MGQITGEHDEVRLVVQAVHRSHSFLEGPLRIRIDRLAGQPPVGFDNWKKKKSLPPDALPFEDATPRQRPGWPASKFQDVLLSLSIRYSFSWIRPSVAHSLKGNAWLRPWQREMPDRRDLSGRRLGCPLERDLMASRAPGVLFGSYWSKRCGTNRLTLFVIGVVSSLIPMPADRDPTIHEPMTG